MSPSPSWSRLCWISCCGPWSTERCSAGAGGAGLGVGQRGLGRLGRGDRLGAVKAGVEDAASTLERADATGEGPRRRRTAEAGRQPVLQRRNLSRSTWLIANITMNSTISRVIMSA